jgi:hypothetical protein
MSLSRVEGRWPGANNAAPRRNSSSPFVSRPILFLRQEGERHGGENAHKRGNVIPPDFLAEVQDRKDAKDRQRDDFLDDLQLRGGINRVAPAIGWHLQQVFEERDAPTGQDDQQQRLAFEFQMAVPRERHKHVRAGQQHNRQPAGLSQVVHSQKMNGPAKAVKREESARSKIKRENQIKVILVRSGI